MKQRVIFYYEDEFDTQIRDFFANVPPKRRGEVIRAALVKVIEGNVQATPVAPVVWSAVPVGGTFLGFEPEF
jgi:hypothetical protein